MAFGAVPVHCGLCGRAANGSLRDTSHNCGAIASLLAGYAGTKPRLAARRTTLDCWQRLLVPGGLVGAARWALHIVSAGSTAAPGGGMAGAWRHSYRAARKSAPAGEYWG